MTRVHAFDFSSRLQDTLSFIVELILHGTFFPNIPLLFPTMSLFFSKIPLLFLKIPIFYHPFTAKLTIFSPSSLNPAPALQDIKSLRWSGSTITILTPLLSYSKSWVTYHTSPFCLSGITQLQIYLLKETSGQPVGWEKESAESRRS